MSWDQHILENGNLFILISVQACLICSPALYRYLSEKKQSSNEGPLKSYALGDNALDEIPPNEIKDFVEGVCSLKFALYVL